MLINVLKVEVSTKPTAKGGTYQMADVAYQDLSNGGKVGSKKIMSFTNKDVWEVIANAKPSDTFEIGLVKGEKYWEWTSAKRAAAPAAGVNQSSTKMGIAGSVTQTNSRGFETPEERARKQVYIVRQSSLTNAIATLTVGRKSEVKPEEVIDLAKQYEAYVLDLNTSPENVAKTDVDRVDSFPDDDIPF